MDVEELFDRVLELAGAAVSSATKLALREQGEPALDEVDPRCARRSEREVKAWVA